MFPLVPVKTPDDQCVVIDKASGVVVIDANMPKLAYIDEKKFFSLTGEEREEFERQFQEFRRSTLWLTTWHDKMHRRIVVEWQDRPQEGP